jgi:ketosteroid isomerase-like protein
VTVSAADEVLDHARRRSDALVAKDADALRRLLHEDFLYVTATGDVVDREEYLGRFVLDEQVRWLSQTLHEPRVAVAGDTAVITGLVHDVAQWGDNAVDATFRTTMTWVRAGGGWRCLAGHTSQPS